MGFNSMIILGTVVLTVLLAVSAAPSDVKELRTTSTQQDKALKSDKTSDVEPHVVEKQLVKSSADAKPVIPEIKEKSLKASTDSKTLATKDEGLKSSETAGFVYSWGHHYPYFPYNYYYNYPYYYL